MTALDSKPSISFAELGVRDEIVRALADTGKEHAFAIQELTLPLALAGDDLIGQARTGMGKTLAFGVPLLHRITGDTSRPLNGTPRALIVVPTRELCLQVYNDLAAASKYLRADNVEGHADRKFNVTSIYGGRPYEPQIEELRRGVDVVVGTPGRLLDLAQQGHLQLGSLSVLVLDEADEMLDLGFLPDIERILRLTPDDRQAMLFSATMPGPIITLARTFMNQPTHIRAEAPQSSQTHDTTEQFAYRAHALDKIEMVGRILQAEGRGATMIFTRTKRTAQKVADELAERGFKVGAVHGDLGQIAREKALKAFRTGEVDVLVATDVAARGIDIDDITHVINYQIPEDEQAYVHRIGRTGRAGKTGIAVTLVDWDELPRWTTIDKALGLNNPDPLETYSSSPHLFDELKIPTDVTGSLNSRKAKPRTEGERVERTERTERPARDRGRQRTRAGQPATGHPEQGETANAPQESTDGPTADTASVSEGTDAPAKRRRRRRPRKTSTTAAGLVVAARPPRSLRSSPQAGGAPSPPPERRTRGDLLAAAAIALVVVVGAALIWWTSDARDTVSKPATAPVPTLTPATRVPTNLRELWSAPSGKTTLPQVVAGALVTGDGGAVIGRDPVTGTELWSYTRDLELCGVTSAYQYAVAVYPDRRGCGQVSTIDAGTGKRGASRTAYADPEVRLSSDGSTVLSAGDSRLELWRSDMVRMISWGALDARVKPDVPQSPLCRLVSAGASSAAVSVLESCPEQTEMRLTLLRPADEEDTPEVKYEQQPGVSSDADARVIAVSDTTTAVYLPTPKPVVNIVDDTGTVTASTLLATAPSDQAAMTRAGDLTTWWTGDSVLVFESGGLRYKYTVAPTAGGAPIGPATVMAGELLVPVTDGYDVFNAETGTGIRHIDLQRPAGQIAVVPAAAGSTLVEQRGDTVVALGSP